MNKLDVDFDGGDENPHVVVCRICGDVLIRKEEIRSVLGSRQEGIELLKDVAEKLPFVEGNDIENLKRRTDDEWVRDIVKGKITKHLGLNHKTHIIRHYPMFFSGRNSWKRIKKDFWFDWEILAEFEVYENE